MKRFLLKQKGLFALLLALGLGMTTAYAYNFSKVCTTGQTLYYNITDATNHYVQLVAPGGNSYTGWDGYTKPTGDITLPSTVTYNGTTYSVKAIGNYAFYGCTGLTGSLVIPNSVTTIGISAFESCYGFSGSLFIGSSVTTIGDLAFAYNVGISRIRLFPETPPTLGNIVFEDMGGAMVYVPCGSLATYLADEGWYNAYFYNMYEICDPLIYEINDDGVSVTVIGHVDGVAATGTLTIPQTKTIDGVTYAVTTIGVSAFEGCSGFTGSLTIPNSVTEIGFYAFNGCSGFDGTLTIGTSVSVINGWAFHGCSNFTQVKYNAISCEDLFPENPFEECGGTLIIGNNVQRIPACIFMNADFTGSLTIPNSVTEIGQSAFAYCTDFTGSLTIGSSVTSIENYAFIACNNFSSMIILPVTPPILGEDVFQYVSNTLPVYVPCGILNAYQNASGWNQFTNMQEVCDPLIYSINEDGVSVTVMGHVYGTAATGMLTIPETKTIDGVTYAVTTINNAAFWGCTGLTGLLTIPNSVTTIGSYAFEYCTGFTGLILGNSVTTIGNLAFYECVNLSSITVLPETPPTLGTNVFYGIPNTIPVYVPCGSLADYQSASGWSNFSNISCGCQVTVTAVPAEGGTVTGGGIYANGTTCTVTATPNPNYQFMSWIMNGEVVSNDATYNFTVTGDAELEAVFSSGIIVGENEGTNAYLPSYSYYNYTLTQQIYTPDELGGNRTITTITSISFFNTGEEKTRNYDIYLKHTSKTAFSGTADWISTTPADKVFSGTVTMKQGTWTTIVLDTPFSYNGSSNLALIVDDNTGTWANGMSCRIYYAQGNQTLRIYSDDTNYNPSSPSSYGGTLMTVKNQIYLNREVFDITVNLSHESAGIVTGWGQYGYGELCTLNATAYPGYTFVNWTNENGTVVSEEAEYTFTVTGNRTLTANFQTNDIEYCDLIFDLTDSYGDGWNGNYLVVSYGSVTEQLTLESGITDSYTLQIPKGNHVELSWIMGSYTGECSFVVRYSDGGVVYEGSNLSESFQYGFDVDCATGSSGSTMVYVGDNGTTTNDYLPSYSYYNYSLTEQIYTADEIGMVGTITGIAFYNDGQMKTRTYDIYLKTTEKTTFGSVSDWISASATDKVFSGSVTMLQGIWTPIVFDTPFEYNGSSNLVLIVDDNTGSYTNSPHMSCRVYTSQGYQALRVFSDNTNYDPTSPSSYTGSCMTEKNQLMLDITQACLTPFDLETTDVTATSANINWNSANDSFELQYREMGVNNDFEFGLGNWTTIDADGDGHNWFYVTGNNYNPGHDGSAGLVESESWYNSTALTPDNYLVSPRITLGGSISFWACAQDQYYSAEHFGVAVSTTGNTNASNFTTIQEWTMTAKGEGTKTDLTRDGGTRQGGWYQYTVDLSAYAGQTGYVAIRHFNCTDMYRLDVDDITVVQPGVNSSWTTVSNVTSPYTLTGLKPETQYEVMVRSICDEYQYSDWAYTSFTTMCEHTVALSAGINWFSTYLDINLDDLKAALVEALPGTTNIRINSQNGTTSYNGSIWRGTLNSLDVTQMYMIQVDVACEITLTGQLLNPAEHPVTIHNGSNWMGFQLGGSMSLLNAFNGFAANGDKVSSQANGSSTYNGTSWRGTLNNLVPGQGYIYNSNVLGDRTFTFPANAK